MPFPAVLSLHVINLNLMQTLRNWIDSESDFFVNIALKPIFSFQATDTHTNEQTEKKVFSLDWDTKRK